MQSSRTLVFISILMLTATLVVATDLSGRVTFRGSPLVGAVVTANLVGVPGKVPVTVTQTDSRGGYALRRLRAGTYILLVDLDGRRIFQGRIVLTSSNFVKNIELR